MVNIAIVSAKYNFYNNYKFNLKNNRDLNIFNHDNLLLETLHSR
jgi:hypothetical protein